MEHAQRVKATSYGKIGSFFVLILILMEHAQREQIVILFMLAFTLS